MWMKSWGFCCPRGNRCAAHGLRIGRDPSSFAGMRTFLMLSLSLFTVVACTARGTKPDAAPDPVVAGAQDAFFDRLRALCGQSYAGRLAVFNEADAKLFAGPAVMQVRSCTDQEIRIPFHVGEDRSRTWVVTRTSQGLRLKHDHRHEDGSSDALTMYGGDSAGEGSAGRQEFPADAESKAMFRAGGLLVSIDNVWAIDIEPGRLFAYELRRPDRHFRVEFDLATPVAAPPPPWGAQP